MTSDITKFCETLSELVKEIDICIDATARLSHEIAALEADRDKGERAVAALQAELLRLIASYQLDQPARPAEHSRPPRTLPLPDDGRPYLRTSDAAAYMDLSVERFRHLYTSGALPKYSTSPGRTAALYFAVEDLDSLRGAL